jgi:hypothetical protein
LRFRPVGVRLLSWFIERLRSFDFSWFGWLGASMRAQSCQAPGGFVLSQLDQGKGGVQMKELKIGCARPTGAKIGEQSGGQAAESQSIMKKEGGMSVVRVGQKAPDFEAPAYQDGKFGQVKLSDYQGKWVVLCFYPGDFTFV